MFSKKLLKHSKTTNLENYNSLTKSSNLLKNNVKGNKSSSAYTSSNLLKNREGPSLKVIVHNIFLNNLKI